MREKATLTSSGGSANASPDSQLTGNPYDDPSLTRYAADDVEEATAGYNAQFRLVVKNSAFSLYEESLPLCAQSSCATSSTTSCE